MFFVQMSLLAAVAIFFSTFVTPLVNFFLSGGVYLVGSLFYGVILGLFVCALRLQHLGGRAVAVAGVVAQLLVITLFFATEIGFVWYNAIGCAVMMEAIRILKATG